jgi:AAA family ATP:ADP antiporter
MGTATAAGEANVPIVLRILRLFTVIRPGEPAKALLLTLNSFLIMFAYYQIKPVREGLLLSAHSATLKSYLAIPQAIILIFVIKAFARIASRLPRHLLITYVTLFCISNLVLFNILHWIGVPVSWIGIIFFIWIGMFNLLIPAQFWGFANDIYSEEEGKRLFPMIAFGASLGAVVGPMAAETIIPLFKDYGSYGMMLVTSVLLVLCIALSWAAHRLDQRQCGNARATEETCAEAREKPLERSGGFKLVLGSRYLLLIALMIGLYNFINASGEQMFTTMQQKAALRILGTGTTGGAALQSYLSAAFAGYQKLGNTIGLLIQLFLVSRVFRWIGAGGALFFLPVIALGGYGYAAFGASLVFLKWLKAFENGTDYSMMKTARSALFLITSREEKYKAQAAIETFFVRGGDSLNAIVVWIGTTCLAMSIEDFALVNVVGITVWIVLCALIVREYRRLKAAARAVPGP